MNIRNEFLTAEEELNKIDKEWTEQINAAQAKVNQAFETEKKYIEEFAAKSNEAQQKELEEFDRQKRIHDQYLENQETQFSLRMTAEKQKMKEDEIKFEKEQARQREQLQEEIQKREEEIRKREEMMKRQPQQEIGFQQSLLFDSNFHSFQEGILKSAEQHPTQQVGYQSRVSNLNFSPLFNQINFLSQLTQLSFSTPPSIFAF
jgi:hypothetical protein